MPDFSLFSEAFPDFDPENSGGLFNRRLAIALPTREAAWRRSQSGEKVVRRRARWLLDEAETLGTPRVHDGSVGRGAEGWIPVVEWSAEAIAGGVVDLIVAAAMAELLRKLRASRRRFGRGSRKASDPPEPRFYISRGVAGAVAADHVVTTYRDLGPLEVEAIEEPSSIAGHAVAESSYVGLEPWVVLLRNAEAERRYYVVVTPDGTIMGDISTPFTPWEALFMRPADVAES